MNGRAALSMSILYFSSQGKCGYLDEAKRIFNRVNQPDTITYNSMS